MARGDAGTVARHLRALSAQDTAAAATYARLAAVAADRAQADGRLTDTAANAVRGALTAGEP